MKNLIMVCALVLGASVAQAGGFIEPYIGIQKGEFTDSVGNSPDSKGTGLGLRLGYQMVIPWVALDVRMNKGTVDSTTEYDYSGTDVGITVGASVPFLRPFVGYVPTAKQKIEGGGTSNEFEGNALKLGLGIKLLPLIDINIDQTTYTFKKIDGVDLATENKHKITTIGIGMTF